MSALSAEENKTIVLAMMDQVQAGRLEALDAHPAMVEMKPFFQQLVAAFPDLSTEVRETLADGAWVACRMMVRGTQHGDWMGLPATNRTATWEVIATCRLAAGTIVEQHAQADNLSLMQQLGVAPRVAAESVAR